MESVDPTEDSPSVGVPRTPLEGEAGGDPAKPTKTRLSFRITVGGCRSTGRGTRRMVSYQVVSGAGTQPLRHLPLLEDISSPESDWDSFDDLLREPLFPGFPGRRGRNIPMPDGGLR